MTMTQNRLSSQMKRLSAYLPDPVYKELEQWADVESRSLSNLVSYLLERAIDDRRKSRLVQTEQAEKKA